MSQGEAGVNPKLPTWDGDWRTFADYKLACLLERDGLKADDRDTLAPRLARNLTGKAWEACIDVDREKLKKAEGLEYLLDYLKGKRGKQQVDILGEAFEKYFQSGDAVRQDRESLTDFEQRLSVHFRDIRRALQELGSTSEVPQEIYGWFLLNKHVRLDPSDIATLKSQAASYKLPDVWAALRKMWGGDSLVIKDQERKRSGKAFVAATLENETEEEWEPSSVWWNDPEEGPDEEPEDDGGAEIWFEEALEALQGSPNDEVILANFQEAKKAFYKDARKALDQSRVSRGFYPPSSGKGKGPGKGKADGKNEFRGKCMRCGKWGHKAQSCPQGGGKGKTGGRGTGVGFVFTNWTAASNEPGFTGAVQAANVRAIVDCGASESIIGAWTLQHLSSELDSLGFDPNQEITLDHGLKKTFIFGNNESSQAWGEPLSRPGSTEWSRSSRCTWWRGRLPCSSPPSGCMSRKLSSTLERDKLGCHPSRMTSFSLSGPRPTT